jgi:hypothetical protein
MPFVFLALPGKENNRPVQHILTTPSGVYFMPFVFLALPGKENNRPVQHILTIPSGVYFMPFVFLALPVKEKQQTCATHSYNTLWCVLNAVTPNKLFRSVFISQQVLVNWLYFWTNNLSYILNVNTFATSPWCGCNR